MMSLMSVESKDELRLSQERDLYLGLLNLNGETALEPFLRQALELMLRIAGASQGYLALFDESDDPGWWTAAGVSETELEEIRSLISHGIIAEAVASGNAVVTPSALLDPRF
ncbi:MAG TPA: AAA family ATPase, partial [Polyangiaceae bacterium]|nr:AAA family ATPase [Polyangiaceae bacterium]